MAATGLLFAQTAPVPKKDAVAEKPVVRYTWPELPTKGQINTVAVNRVKSKADEPKSINAEIMFKLGADALAVVGSTKTGTQTATGKGSSNEISPHRMEINFDALLEDWKRYAKDAGEADSVSQESAGRERQILALAKPDFSGVKYEFPENKPVVLEPWFRGIPETQLEARQKLIGSSLMITDLKVVNNERAVGNGKWSFGYLMRQLANEEQTGIHAEELAERWVAHWNKDLEIAGAKVTNRKDGMAKLLAGWPRKKDGKLDLDKAPFRLLAIVSRLDLRNNLILGAQRVGGGGAGEGRFVFCALNEKQEPLAFTVIFEYQIKKSDFEGVRHWAKQWYDLSSMELGGDAYLKALEALTEQFAGANNDPENPPNRSALAALRTNEIELDLLAGKSPPLWELREFRLASHSGGYLEQVTAKQTPQLGFNNKLKLADFINAREKDILGMAHRTPVEFPPGEPFLDGASITPVNLFWNVTVDPKVPATKINGDARHLFSLGTCSGCHAAEAFRKVENFMGDPVATVDQIPPMFTHVRPRMADKVAKLSPFLQGEGKADFSLTDPAGQIDANGALKSRPFGDLRRRADDLYALVNYGWYYELHRLPIQFVH